MIKNTHLNVFRVVSHRLLTRLAVQRAFNFVDGIEVPPEIGYRTLWIAVCLDTVESSVKKVSMRTLV